MFDLRAQETAEGEADSRTQAAERRQVQRAPREGIGEGSGEKHVQHNGSADQLRRWQPGKDAIERVQYRGLDVGQERHPHEQVGVPQREPPLAQSVCGKLTVGVEVPEHIEAG